MTTIDLIDTKEIARLLGVTRAHCVGRIIKRPDFPKPVINLSQRIRKWRKDEVYAYIGIGKQTRGER
jgi:predicted DNA-binding transcriptional regulator AlpA